MNDLSRSSPPPRWANAPLTTEDGPTPRAFVDHDEVSWRPADARAAFERARNAILRCDIYPRRRLVAEVFTPDARVSPGALVVQRIRAAGFRFEAGVRVTEVFDSEASGLRRAGFSYATLEGHPERGVATFAVEFEEERGRVTFRIDSWSEPHVWWARLAQPIVRGVQRKARWEAFDRIARVVGA